MYTTFAVAVAAASIIIIFFAFAGLTLDNLTVAELLRRWRGLHFIDCATQHRNLGA